MQCRQEPTVSPRPTGVNYRTAPLASPACDWLSLFERGSTLVCTHCFDGALFIRADQDAEIDDLYYSCGLELALLV